MSDPSTLRDSTQIVLPSDALEGIREDLTEKFTLTLFEMDETAGEGGTTGESGPSDEPAGSHYVRIIGSPVEIKGATDFLGRHGVTIR